MLRTSVRDLAAKSTSSPEQPWGYLLEAVVDRIVHNDSDELYEIHFRLKHGEIAGVAADLVVEGQIAYPKLRVLTADNLGRAKD